MDTTDTNCIYPRSSRAQDRQIRTQLCYSVEKKGKISETWWESCD